LSDWHVLKSVDGSYAAKKWEIFNASLRRPRAALAPQLNENPVDVVICLYTDLMDAIRASVQYHDILGAVMFPVPIVFHGQGPKNSIILEREPWATTTGA
jgi:hypothetical protein